MKKKDIFDNYSSKFYSDRLHGAIIDTIIIHSMYSPESQDPFSISSCKNLLDEHEVSVHYVISRAGQTFKIVPEEKQAWHAGVSKLPEESGSRSMVNQFSIGVELIGPEKGSILQEQYLALAKLVIEICKRHPVINIYGHSDIAPERKTDPWGFDWMIFRKKLKEMGMETDTFSFP
jgi:N-acetyl-anhydromuramyl-L-alanine amidase AmpD